MNHSIEPCLNRSTKKYGVVERTSFNDDLVWTLKLLAAVVLVSILGSLAVYFFVDHARASYTPCELAAHGVPQLGTPPPEGLTNYCSHE